MTVSDVQSTLRDIAKRKNGSRLLTRMTGMETVLNSLENYTKVVEVFVNDLEINGFIWVQIDLSFAYPSHRLLMREAPTGPA